MYLRTYNAALFIILAAQYVDLHAEPNTGGPQSYQPTDNYELQQTDNHVITRMSQRDRFKVSIRSESYPVPLSQMHSWSVHVEMPDGTPVSDADIGIFGSMPAHKHGLPSRPRVTENRDGGDYLVEGVKFTMPGEWQLILIITADGKRDKATFRITLP